MPMDQGMASATIKAYQVLVSGTGVGTLTTDAKAGSPYKVLLENIAPMKLPYRFRLTAGTGHDNKAKITCQWIVPRAKEEFTLNPGDVVVSDNEGFLESILSDIDPKADLKVEAIYKAVSPAGLGAVNVVGITKDMPDAAMGTVVNYYYNEMVDVIIPVARKIDPGQDLVPDANGKLTPRLITDTGDTVGRSVLALPACKGKECKLRAWFQPRSF
jgi:hypothetical protein